MNAANTNPPQNESGSGAQRVLLWIVVSMGFALVGGSALLIGKIVNKSEECTLETLNIPAGSRVISANEDELLLQTQDASMLQLYDLCRGQLRREITLQEAQQ